jgi:tRNA (guanine37-N1)-methyltransferase
MQLDILTLFPAIFDGFLTESLLARAQAAGLITIHRHDFRQWTTDKHQHVDDRPYGGGPGMVIKVEPVVSCVEWVQTQAAAPGKLILLTPQGRPLNQRHVETLAACPRLVLLCGRYEGFDQRVIDILKPEELSVGDFVLNGGEVAAMCVIDAVARLIPGVLGDEESSVTDSFSSGNRLLEHAQYTRPREYRGHTIPEVLLSGDHAAIARWRAEQSYLKTLRLRADLLASEQAAPE